MPPPSPSPLLAALAHKMTSLPSRSSEHKLAVLFVIDRKDENLESNHSDVTLDGRVFCPCCFERAQRNTDRGALLCSV